MSDWKDPRLPRVRWPHVLVVALIVVVLVGLLLPVIGTTRDGDFRRAQCGKNQSQLLGALVAFTTSEEVSAWIPGNLPIDPQATGAYRGRLVTTKLFERVAASQSIPNALFKCPYSARGGPERALKPNPADPASAWGLGTGHLISYALDWAAPADPSSERPVIADRDPTAHKGSILVAFGDAHVKTLKLVPATMRVAGALVTDGPDGQPVAASTGNLPGDDVYSADGDDGEPLNPGKGDPLRAWVK